jgi:hypothetical protein
MRATWLLLLTGCTLLNDPAAHMGGARDVPAAVDVPEIPLDDLCDQLAALYCGAMANCCMSVATPPDCVARVTTGCDGTFGRGLLRDARTGYDPAAAAAYFAAGRSLAATCEPEMLEWSRNLLPVILDGIRAPGAECTPDAIDGGFDFGALLSCDGAEYACVYGGLDRWTCAARVGEGAGCYLQSDCSDGLYCDGVPGVCRPRLPAGAPCDPEGDECAGVCYPSNCIDPSEELLYCYGLVEL